jgi:Calcineurin-like phosphoesterase
VGTWAGLMPKGTVPLSWIRPSVLWRCRNDTLARILGDPTNDERRRWIAAQLERGVDPDFAIVREDPETFSFMLLGDTGEGDASQYVTIPGLLKISEGTRFAVISSDLLYPSGSGNEYGTKFYRPYKDYPAPIYAIPGNHDWYDNNGGFMRVFCDAPVPPLSTKPRALSAAWWRRLAWKDPDRLDVAKFEEARALRGRPEQQAVQPGPYWTIDAGPIRLVGIDTGILGGIDRDQGEWLRRVSAGPKPKILVTGKPLHVDNEHHPGAIEGTKATVDDIVSDPANHYVAAIGGDIHNYQHYPVKVGDRILPYLVSGGGGAFMHATHTIPKVNIDGVTEDQFRSYPLRGDSLSFYSKLYGRRLHLRRFFELSPEQAAAVMAERIGVEPSRGATQTKVTFRMRLVAGLLGAPPKPHRRTFIRLPVRRLYQRFFSPVSAWTAPPFFKSFLRIDVSPTGLRIRCYAATGCLEHEIDPPLEDELTITF